MNILLTGGAGYVGSHIAVELLLSGHRVIVVDNLSNSNEEVITRIKNITCKDVAFIKGDICNTSLLDAVFKTYNIDLVIHTAGLKAVAESAKKPIEYYHANIFGTISLCQAMQRAGVLKLVFSSSATVYGSDSPVPFTESTPRGKTINPYGTSKAVVEKILEDISIADPKWSIAILRFFNPIGAHPSGLIGEQPSGIPNNLMPFISQVAVGHLPELSIYGNDYPTEDGTCQRDYLHVVDIAQGHLKVLDVLCDKGVQIFNLGTGKGTSVLELVDCFIKETGKNIPYSFHARRVGDLPAFWADIAKARDVLGWEAKLTINDMVRDTWNWQLNNPNGYNTTT